jgi:hypothetical protein
MNSVHVVGGYWTKVRCISIAIEWSRQVGEIAVVCCTQLQCGACLPYFIGMSQGEHSDLRVLAPVGAEGAQSSLSALGWVCTWMHTCSSAGRDVGSLSKGGCSKRAVLRAGH